MVRGDDGCAGGAGGELLAAGPGVEGRRGGCVSVGGRGVQQRAVRGAPERDQDAGGDAVPCGGGLFADGRGVRPVRGWVVERRGGGVQLSAVDLCGVSGGHGAAERQQQQRLELCGAEHVGGADMQHGWGRGVRRVGDDTGGHSQQTVPPLPCRFKLVVVKGGRRAGRHVCV